MMEIETKGPDSGARQIFNVPVVLISFWVHGLICIGLMILVDILLNSPPTPIWIMGFMAFFIFIFETLAAIGVCFLVQIDVSPECVRQTILGREIIIHWTEPGLRVGWRIISWVLIAKGGRFIILPTALSASKKNNSYGFLAGKLREIRTRR